MLSQSILLTAVLGSPPSSPTDVTRLECAPLPPEPVAVRVDRIEDSRPQHARSWGGSASYLLSNGELGEAFMVIDANGRGEAQIMIDGDIIAHVAIDSSASSAGPVVTTWLPPSVSHEPEAIAEMMRVSLPAILAESLPQEFKCSGWGKAVLKAGKYLAVATIGAAGAACCSLTAGAGCYVCGAGVAVGSLAAVEFADGYCD